LKAMVLAAGVGTRLDPLTTQIPKPLVPVANRPVMEYIVNLLVQHGFTQISVNLHHLPDSIENYFGDGSRLGVKINYLFEKNLSGDAGGVRGCMEHLSDSTFVVIMGDLLTDANISYLVEQHRKMKALATIALKPVKDVSQFGVAVLDDQGWIKEFQEKPHPNEARSNLASTGIYIFEPAIFDFIPRTGVYGFGKQLFPQLIKEKQPVLGLSIESYWSDVGTFTQYRQSNFDVLNGKFATKLLGIQTDGGQFRLWQGDNAKVDPTSSIEGNVLLGNNSVIKGHAKIIGNVVIGDDCIIEEGALIQDTVIWSGSCVGRHAKIKNSVLGVNSKIENEKSLNEEAFIGPRSVAHSEPPSKFPSITSNKKG